MERSCFLLYVMLLVMHCFIACLALPLTNITTDQSALLAFKAHITSDPQNILITNWSATAHVCDWIGITCGTRHQRVTVLRLPYMNLTGTIPPDLGNMSFLTEIRLRNNSFHGSLPSELAQLRRLTYMSFGFNNLGGEIPSWLGLLPKLQYLHLFDNNFIGSIPPSLCNISTLKTLELSGNALEGYIPEEISNLPNLEFLLMSSIQIEGSIPSSIFNISSLKMMDLSHNMLTGSLPEDICQHLPNLQQLLLLYNLLVGPLPRNLWKCRELLLVSLTDNGFTGSIPRDIGNLTQVKEIYLALNNLSGEIPEEIGNLLALETITLFGSGLTGPIPKSFGNCTSLKVLELGNNYLTGSIPLELGELHNLEGFFIRYNNMIGHIPPKIFNISTIKGIALQNNSLSGSLPPTIGLGLPNLELLYLWGNEFSGIIPSSISNCSKLTVIELGHNSFSGSIPSTLGNLIYLHQINVENNYLTSESSTSEQNFLSSFTNCKELSRLVLDENPLNNTLHIPIGNLSTSLQYFSAFSCKIKGSIPREMGSLTHLTVLNLQNNELVGSIPVSVGKLQKLQGLSLDGNRLEGSIPHDICNLTNLATLFLNGNKLFGSVPACLGNLTSLRSLHLGSNNLTSIIPANLWSLKDILLLNLSSNSLSGPLPLDVEHLKVAIKIDLSRNQLSGDIPSGIGGLENLMELSLAHNRFQGPIPESFGNLISLEFLDLSGNNLSGAIPKSLEKLVYLHFLNVSSNRLQGEIPTGGPFGSFSAQSFRWNDELCGASRLQVPPCKNGTLRPSKTAKANLLKYILPAIAAVVLALAFFLYLVGCRKRNAEVPAQEDQLSLPTWKRISYLQLQQATDGFSSINLIGTGSYGSVYKGTLTDGMSIALKVFNLQQEGTLKSFDVECEILSNILHRNLIKIISSCSMFDFKALVLEYMSNGSLEKSLYSEDYCLDILQRINIMIDVASALEYLHYDCSTPIVHSDLKPSNVLLNEDMVAHLSDFGIAKLLGEGASMAETMTLATIGYMAPEYGSEGIISIRGDVYSYGIMMIETFTRKRPTDEMFAGEMSLKNWIKMSLSHAVTEVVDTNLLISKEEHFEAMKVCLSSIMRLALDCSAELPTERMNMKDALATLKKIKVKFLTEIG